MAGSFLEQKVMETIVKYMMRDWLEYSDVGMVTLAEDLPKA